MKRTILLLLSFCLSLFALRAQTSDALQQLQVDVVYLSSDYLEGRETGLKGERLAADYIAWRFKELGLEPVGEQGSWFHEFDFTYKSNPHAEGGEARTGKNVLGFLDNGADHTVVIGAHYDHLGYGAFGSLHAGEAAIHNGADDNASGVAAMLYLAKRLKDNPQAAHNNYLFFAISGEELGLVGSKKWVANPTVDLGTLNYMINMDMVGRLNEEKVLAIYGTGTSPSWDQLLPSIKIGGIKPTYQVSGVGPSDHTSFYLQDIPVLHFFSGQHSDYHKPSDDAHLINYPGILYIGDFILALIERADTEGKLTFTATKNEDNQRQVAAFKVTLGVMPDYVHSGDGMRIDSVIEGRPGQVAGLKAGDVIIQIGELEVGDIYDYMEGLSKFQKGDHTTVKIKRGEEVLELKVTF
ncbi:MAG: M28 family peptidase [Bacteroidetes bacterium]|nr:MAG: M28 family peptidase [Bacteroidota bacterium]